MRDEKTWAEIVAPIVARCELAAKLDMNATWNSDGADALGQLIKKMADRLDTDLHHAQAQGRT